MTTSPEIGSSWKLLSWRESQRAEPLAREVRPRFCGKQRASAPESAAGYGAKRLHTDWERTSGRASSQQGYAATCKHDLKLTQLTEPSSHVRLLADIAVRRCPARVAMGQQLRDKLEEGVEPHAIAGPSADSIFALCERKPFRCRSRGGEHLEQ